MNLIDHCECSGFVDDKRWNQIPSIRWNSYQHDGIGDLSLGATEWWRCSDYVHAGCYETSRTLETESIGRSLDGALHFLDDASILVIYPSRSSLSWWRELEIWCRFFYPYFRERKYKTNQFPPPLLPWQRKTGSSSLLQWNVCLWRSRDGQGILGSWLLQLCTGRLGGSNQSRVLPDCSLSSNFEFTPG